MSSLLTVFEIMTNRRKKAYTLVELLVVIAVIAILFTVVFVGTSSTDGTRLSSAERTLAGLIKTARSQAILKSTKVRMIIHDDNSNIEKFNRFIGIVYQNDDGSGWIAADKGTYLPKGIYFDETRSNALSPSAIPSMLINYLRLSAQSGNAEFDSDGNQIIRPSYLYYEFNDNGTFAVPNMYLVFGVGQFTPGDKNPTFPTAKDNLKSALLIRRSGSAVLIDDPGTI